MPQTAHEKALVHAKTTLAACAEALAELDHSTPEYVLKNHPQVLTEMMKVASYSYFTDTVRELIEEAQKNG